jgi:hypothetical protein
MDLVARLQQEITESIELDALAEEIATFVARIDACEHELLTRLREFDARQGWVGKATSCARWLSWRTRLSMQAARERVRVARALGGLPRIDDAMRRGELSYSKVRALSRVATPETELKWIETAQRVAADHLEYLCRERRHVGRRAGVRSRIDRRFVRRKETPHGMVRIEIQLPPAEAEVVWGAIMAATERTREPEAPPVTDAGGDDAAAVASAEASDEAAPSTVQQPPVDASAEASPETAVGEVARASGEPMPESPAANSWFSAEEALRAVRAELRAHEEARTQAQLRSIMPANDGPEFEELRADAIVTVAESFMRRDRAHREAKRPRPP